MFITVLYKIAWPNVDASICTRTNQMGIYAVIDLKFDIALSHDLA